MADEQTASERWIEERTLRYPTNPDKEYEYGLTPEEEGTQDAWAYDYPMAQHLLRLPAKIVGALTPYRRRIITPSETIMEPVIDAPSDTYRKTVTAPEYGPREFAIPYMPVRQGLAAFAEGLKNVATDPEARKQLLQGIASLPGALWQQQVLGAEAMGRDASAMFDLETGQEYGFDPSLFIGPMAAAGTILRPSGTFVGMFAGMKSPLADMDALKTAQKMEKEGVDRDAIWRDTGWWNDKGDWKFEISDEAARARDASLVPIIMEQVKELQSDPKAIAEWLKLLPRKPDGKQYTLDDVLEHPELMKLYPDQDGLSVGAYRTNRRFAASARHNIPRVEKEIRRLEKQLTKAQSLLSDPVQLAKAVEAVHQQNIRRTGRPGWGPGEVEKSFADKTEDLKEQIAIYKEIIEEKTKNLSLPEYGAIGDVPVTSGTKYADTLGEYDVAEDAVRLSTGLRKAAPPVTPKIQEKLDRYNELTEIGNRMTYRIPPELTREWSKLDKELSPWLVRKPQGKDNYTQTLLHELQHAIQSRENWARGGSTSGVKKGKLRKFYTQELHKILQDPDRFPLEHAFRVLETNDIDKVLTNLRKTRFKQWQRFSDEAAENVYFRLAGEVEARLVEARRNMTNEERRRIPPWKMLDQISRPVPEEDLIVAKAAGGFIDKPLYNRSL